jgi:hypothetical protein
MMYGEELHIINSANADAALATAIALEVAATTILLAKTMEASGGSLYWGFRPTVTFNYDTLTALGVLGLRRKSKVIKTAVLGNAGGTGYAVGDKMSVTQTGATGGILEVVSAPGGIVATVKILNPGVNYAAGANLATVALNGSGDNAFTVTISDIVVLGTINLTNGLVAGKLYMQYVSNAIGDESPTPKPPASYNAGELLEIYSYTAATGGAGIAGDFQPILIIQNRGENFAAQGLWVEAA